LKKYSPKNDQNFSTYTRVYTVNAFLSPLSEPFIKQQYLSFKKHLSHNFYLFSGSLFGLTRLTTGKIH
jgi:hypothetical protein